jgi:hypothetical protein
MLIVHAVVRKWIDIRALKFEKELANGTHNSICGLLSLIIAFSLVQAVSNFKQVENIVRQESVKINTLDRLLTRYGSPDLEPVKQSLSQYTHSIVEDEWGDMRLGHASDKTQSYYKKLSQGVFQIKPNSSRENTIYSEAIKTLDSLADSRSERIEFSNIGIPPIYWGLIIGLLIFKSLLSAFLDRSHSASFILSIQMFAFTTLIALTFMFDEALTGDISVKPDILKKTITVIDNRID